MSETRIDSLNGSKTTRFFLSIDIFRAPAKRRGGVLVSKEEIWRLAFTTYYTYCLVCVYMPVFSSRF